MDKVAKIILRPRESERSAKRDVSSRLASIHAHALGPDHSINFTLIQDLSYLVLGIRERVCPLGAKTIDRPDKKGLVVHCIGIWLSREKAIGIARALVELNLRGSGNS